MKRAAALRNWAVELPQALNMRPKMNGHANGYMNGYLEKAKASIGTPFMDASQQKSAMQDTSWADVSTQILHLATYSKTNRPPCVGPPGHRRHLRRLIPHRPLLRSATRPALLQRRRRSLPDIPTTHIQTRRPGPLLGSHVSRSLGLRQRAETNKTRTRRAGGGRAHKSVAGFLPTDVPAHAARRGGYGCELGDMSAGHVRAGEERRCVLAVHLHAGDELQLGHGAGRPRQGAEGDVDDMVDQSLRPAAVGPDIPAARKHVRLLRAAHDGQPHAGVANGSTRRLHALVSGLEREIPRS